MAVDNHRRAEELMWLADLDAAAGKTTEARGKYLEAARAESAAYAETPADKPRTRGILGVSSVALLRRAGQAEEAKRTAYGILAAGGIPPESVLDIEMILDELRTESLAKLYPDPQGLQWALRGGRVGFGIARSETVTAKIDQVQRLAWRVYEMLVGREVRTNQPAPLDVRGAVDLLVTQPVAGSFTFGVRLSDHQLSIDEQRFDAQSITESIYSVIKATQEEAEEPLVETVPDPGYRNVFLRLVRNMSPDGHEVGEIEVREIGKAAPPTVLLPETRVRIRRRLPRHRQTSASGDTEIRDVLRVIDLNRRKIALGPVDHEQRCDVPQDLALVDLIEGLEDRPVRVTGRWRGRVFVVQDIEPDYPDED